MDDSQLNLSSASRRLEHRFNELIRFPAPQVPGSALGFDPYGVTSLALSATHAMRSPGGVGLELWSAAGASALTAVPKAALGFEGYGATSLALSATHVVMSPPDSVVQHWSSATTQRSMFTAPPKFDLAPWQFAVADPGMSASPGTHTVLDVELGEDPRYRGPRPDFLLPSWRRREANLRRLVGKLHRQVTDLRTEVEEQRAAMAGWFEWLESEWFVSQLAAPHPDDEAFDD